MTERKCPHCGAQVPDSDFITLCPACGQSLQAPKDAPAPAPSPAEPQPPAKDVVCSSCGAPNAPQSERCWQCHRPLSGAPQPAAGPGIERESLDLGRILADALATRRPEEDLDEALLRAAKAASPDHWQDLFTVALQMLHQAVASGEQREAAAARLAGEHIDVEISSSHEQSQIRVGEEAPQGAQVFSSLDELPPELRKEIEKRLGPLPTHMTGAKTTVTRRVVIQGDEVPPGVERHFSGISHKVTVESHRTSPPRARGCLSITTLAALLLGCLALRR